MALTRAQLLAGNSSQGTVLPGQVQGVTAGPGVTIDAAGVLSLNGNDPAFNGFVKTNNASAFNAFIWPNVDGSAGQQLTTNGSGTLSWSDPDGIPWTQKGQLVAATGSGSANQTLVNVGTDGQILIADSGTASGLNYTSNYVATGGSTSAAYMPAGTTLARPATPPDGSLRYNSTLTAMEFYNGSSWVGVGGGIPDLGLNLNTTNSLLKAATPYATTPPTAGAAAGQAINGSLYWDTEYGAMFVRYTDANATSQWVMINGNNVTTGALDFPAGPVGGTTYAAPNGLIYTYDGTKGVWTCPAGAQLGLGLATNGGFIKVSIPVASTPPATGTGAAQAMDGSLYWDDVLGALFIRYNDGTTTQWVQTTPSGGGVSSLTASAPLASSGGNTPNITAALATAAQAAAGTSGVVLMTPQFAVPKDASGMTGAALIPGGTNAQQPGSPVGGMFRYNTDLNPDSMEFYDATQSLWIPLATLPQLQGVALDAYSSFSAADGGGAFTFTPQSPGFAIRNTITVPAGYTNFIVYSSVAFVTVYNSTGNNASTYNAVYQNGASAGGAAGQLSYQAVANGDQANFNASQTGSSTFSVATSLATTSNTFNQVIWQTGSTGTIRPFDSSIVVLAWTI